MYTSAGRPSALGLFRPRTLVVLILLVVPAQRALPDDALDLDAALVAWAGARDPVARKDHAEAVRALAPDADVVAARISDAWRWSEDVGRGDVTWERETPDGVVHTVYAHVPATYAADKSWPLLLWLHGDVTRDDDGGGVEGVEALAETAEAEEFILVCPSTQNGSHWWMPNGEDLVFGVLRDVKRLYRIDADRVAVAGRSDGASACFHLLAHHPDPFCCFLAFVGHPSVSWVYSGPTWNSNLASRPIYAINGGRDRLYPAREVSPIVERMRAEGCRLTWIVEPNAGHDLSFLERRWPEAAAFWKSHPREAAPAEVTWTTSRERGDVRRAWVEILRLDPAAASDDAVQPVEGFGTEPTPLRPRLGLRFDADADGAGLLVQEVEEGTPAAEAGFRAGDVLLRAGDVALPDARAIEGLRIWLSELGEAEGVFDVLRSGERIEVRARPRLLQGDAPPTPTDQGYDARPGTVSVAVAAGNRIDVATDGIGALRLYLLPALVDFERELVVVLNGKEVFRGAPPQSLDQFLGEAWDAGPGAPIVLGTLDLEVPPAR